MYEYQIRYRFLGENGLPGSLRFRFFHSAKATHEFLVRLDSVDGRQTVNVSVARRPTGEWSHVTQLELERFAAGEVG
jgi:hypothetical protein